MKVQKLLLNSITGEKNSPLHPTEQPRSLFWLCLAGSCSCLWLGVIMAARWLAWPLPEATNSYPQAKETFASLHVAAQILLVVCVL